MGSKERFENAETPQKETEPVELDAKSPEEARRRATELIYAAVPQIVNKIAANAKKGGLNEAKFILDLFGLSAEKAEAKSPKASKSDAKPAKDNGPSDDDIPPLARILMDTLGAIQREEIKF